MDTAFATQPTKAKPKKAKQISKLLALHNELLGAWIASGLPGHLKIRDSHIYGYALEFCGHEPVNFATLAIYQGDHNFALKKQRILDYLSGKITYLEKEDEHL